MDEKGKERNEKGRRKTENLKGSKAQLRDGVGALTY